MNSLLPFLGLVLLIVLLSGAVRLIKNRPRVAGQIVYEQRKLFSPAEAAFYRVLRSTVGPRYVVLAKVSLGDLIKVRRNVPESAGARNRISQKHVDFVLCDAESLDVVCAIELDDRSHQRERTKARDVVVEAALKDAEIGLVRFPALAAYAPEEIRGKLGVPL